MFNASGLVMQTAKSDSAFSTSSAARGMTAPRRDTRAWTMQVWISFAIAVTLCGTGLAWLPGVDLDRAFMVMGYLFCLCSAFVLSKHVRDQHQGSRSETTPMWSAVVWGGFMLAMALTAWGLWRMDIQPVWKAYLAVSWLFLISTVFTLAKTLRDAHDVRQYERRMQQRAAALGTDT